MPTDPSPVATGLDRRSALTALGLAGAGLAASSALAQSANPTPARKRFFTPESFGWDASRGTYILPPLPYAFDALEPHIDAQTMQIHHGKHHVGYVTGLNKALSELAKIRTGDADPGLIKHWSRELSFHGGGHVNHSIFWITMAPPSAGGGGEPTGRLADAITRDLGSFDAFKKQFSAAAAAVEGSGWAWLVYNPISGRLIVQQMEKQQNMLLTGGVPLLGIDVWEHAYYLKYQNRRADYISAFFSVINWPRVAEMYDLAVTG